MPLTLTDLFVVGLALDIFGATILAKGLLLSSPAIARLSVSYWDYSTADAVSRVEDRIDAEFGLGSLVVGFSCQAVGYALGLFGVPTETGVPEGVLAFALAGATIGIAYGTWRFIKPRRIRRLLVEVSLTSAKADSPGQWNQDAAAKLLHHGEAAGYPVAPEDGDSKVAYARRVFGVDLPDDCA